jgi:hypothetical protein
MSQCKQQRRAGQRAREFVLQSDTIATLHPLRQDRRQFWRARQLALQGPPSAARQRAQLGVAKREARKQLVSGVCQSLG